MADAGEIKAKVTIEYDGSGIEKAKEDLASLAEIGGNVEQSAEDASAGLSGLDEQAAKSAGSAKSLNSAFEGLPKVFESGEASVASFNETLAEQQSVIADTGSAFEEMQKPIENTVSLLEDASPSMTAFSKNAQSMVDSIGSTSEAWGTAGNNIQTFQEALSSPDSFQTIYDHLDKTGQSIEEFTSSIGESNAQLFHEMSTDWAQTNAWVDTAGSSFESVGKSANEGFGAVSASAANADKAVSEFLGNTGKSAKMLEPIGIGEAFSGAGEGILGALSDIAMPLMAVQMIAMAVQQVGQGIYDMAAIAEGPAAHSMGSFTGTVDALGQSAQHAASQFSEGFGQQVLPTLNALNSQAASGNDFWGQLGGTVGGVASTIANLWQVGTGFNPIGGTEGLINQGAQALGFAQPFQGPGPSSQQTAYDVVSVVHQQTVQTHQQIQTLLEDASNPEFLAQQNQLSAAQQVYQRAQQSYDIRHPINQQQMLQDFQYNQYAQQQEANYAYQMQNGESAPYDPIGYWGNFFGSIGHGNSSGFSALFGGTGSGPRTSAWDSSGLGGFFGGIGQDFSNAWNWLTNPSPYPALPPQSSTGGCFVAGTRVRMADGTEKAIETLQIGEKVLACDGGKQITTTILALITPPPKRVYKLTFSDGQTLTLTDSHPVATTEGWKALSVEHAKQENPDLSVTALQIGDSVCTTYGACTLTSILPLQGVRQIYNITVDAPHTFYAGGILVHNKMLNSEIGPQVSEQIGGIQLPHIDLSGMSAQLAGSFGGIQLPHIDLSGIASGLGGAFSGITLPHIDLSSMTAGLSSMFSGISLPAMPDIGGQINGALGGMFSGISLPAIPDIGGQIGGALSGMFSGISLPAIPDIGGELSGALSGMFGGISLPSIPDIGSMISGAMGGMFGGIEVPHPPDIGAMISGAMTGMFGGIQIPSPPNLGAQISSAMSGMFSWHLAAIGAFFCRRCL
jgi:hypothetical protein